MLKEGLGDVARLYIGGYNENGNVPAAVFEVLIERFVPGDQQQGIVCRKRGTVDDGIECLLKPRVTVSDLVVVGAGFGDSAGAIVHVVELIGRDVNERGHGVEGKVA